MNITYEPEEAIELAQPERYLTGAEIAEGRAEEFAALYMDVLLKLAGTNATEMDKMLARMVAAQLWKFGRHTEQSTNYEQLIEQAGGRSAREQRRFAFKHADDLQRLRAMHVAGIKQVFEMFNAIDASSRATRGTGPFLSVVASGGGK